LVVVVGAALVIWGIEARDWAPALAGSLTLVLSAIGAALWVARSWLISARAIVPAPAVASEASDGALDPMRMARYYEARLVAQGRRYAELSERHRQLSKEHDDLMTEFNMLVVEEMQARSALFGKRGPAAVQAAPSPVIRPERWQRTHHVGPAAVQGVAAADGPPVS
jgi:hypothetical protein